MTADHRCAELAGNALLVPFLGAAPVPRAAEELSIAAQPLAGPVGTPITITGQGAPPHAALEIVGGRRSSPGGCAGGLKGGQGNATYFARMTADGAGNFAVTFTQESAGDPSQNHFLLLKISARVAATTSIRTSEKG